MSLISFEYNVLLDAMLLVLGYTRMSYQWKKAKDAICKHEIR